MFAESSPSPSPSPAAANAAFADRLARLAVQAGLAGVDVVIIAPGADLQYFAGHSVGSHERLTALVVPAVGEPQILVPTLERPGWSGSPLEQLGVPFTTWTDGADPYQALIGLLPLTATVLAVDYHMPAVHALGIQAAQQGSELRLAGEIIGELRMRKAADEVAALADIGAAIDRVQARIGEWLRPGRTEAEVAADIAAALVEEGHTRADFVIVASGSNGASPHHEASPKVIEPGDPVVIDIGGPSPAGYYSDCTRTYQVAGDGGDPDFDKVYEIVRQAQQAGVDAVRTGATAESIDKASRSVIEEAGYGEYFITRTGHGIGLEVHEHPYMVSGNAMLLEEGMAFSVEPGIYLTGRFGVRIEDIVVVGRDGPLLMNNAAKTLITVGG
ncbi:Xaa-Pro dipeptidase [Nakamurella sp. UYEF19]|uniref:M24 family metallopeptidase n=1 Tax=Nakamurella sp. UYEF19 TaxID=1756392 RepID=UPI00339B9C20